MSSARRWLDQALQATDAPDPRMFMRCGAELHAVGDLEGAQLAFEQALVSIPEHPGLWNALATVRYAASNFDAALKAVEQALQFAPADPDTVFNAGVIAEALSYHETALSYYRQVLELRQHHPGAMLNLVPLLIAMKQREAALAEAKALVTAHPRWSDAWFNLGEAFTTCSDHAEAQIAYGRVLHLNPADKRADIAIAVALAAQGKLTEGHSALEQARTDFPEAFASFRSPLETDRVSQFPDLDAGRIALLSAFQRVQLCSFPAREELSRLFCNVVQGATCKPFDNPDLLFLAASLDLPVSIRRQAAEQVAKRLANNAFPIETEPRQTRRERLRLAYISGDFRRHPMAWVITRLFELHDRTRFEVFAYSSGPDDNSRDRQRVMAGVDHFVDIATMSAAEIVQSIVADQIDILVDLSGYTLHHRAAALASKPAPIQVNFGFLATMGGPWMDYALLDRVLLTSEERHAWSEAIVYLPQTALFSDDQPALPAVTASRASFELPDEAVVLACLNTSWKIDESTLAAWVEILERVPQAVLWVQADFPECATRLTEYLVDLGVSPKRLYFTGRLEYERHLARFLVADVFLDTFNCNAITICREAIYSALPVVTLAGKTTFGRAAASILRAHGLPELVAASVSEYVRIAVGLASDRASRDAIKVKMRQGLYQSARHTRQIERAYEMMWERYQSGLSPRDFNVPE